MASDETVKKAEEVLLTVFGYTYTDGFKRAARALADAGLLMGAEERECVEACVAWTQATISQNESAKCRLWDAGRAVAAEREPFTAAAFSDGTGWRVCDRTGPIKAVADFYGSDAEQSARAHAAALNAAWKAKP